METGSKLTVPQRAEFYNRRFPDRPPLVAHVPPRRGEAWVSGTWLIGACYKNPNPLYGAYPHGYLERVHAMFPDAQRVLHVFSGGLTEGEAARAAWPEMMSMLEASVGPGVIGVHSPSMSMELVDLHGPEQGRFPTWQGDLFDFCSLPDRAGKFDLVLADPPYSTEDAVKYDVPMVNRGKVMRALHAVTRKGGSVVWLDTCWPMHSSEQWRCWAHIGLVRSTNHRVRLVSMFEAV